METKKIKTKQRSKGDRLNWTPLKDYQPVVLTAEDLIGRRVTSEELSEIKKIHNPRILVP